MRVSSTERPKDIYSTKRLLQLSIAVEERLPTRSLNGLGAGAGRQLSRFLALLLDIGRLQDCASTYIFPHVSCVRLTLSITLSPVLL